MVGRRPYNRQSLSVQMLSIFMDEAYRLHDENTQII
jgi:hypothetical protein